MAPSNTPLTHERLDCDVCVVGGGLAGLCAAVASARNGARTVLIQDRPVLGGNASSEIRMWVCGALGRNVKETGILEELQLENLYRNPSLNYSIWDSVLYGMAAYQPGLTLLLNTSVCDAECDGRTIGSVKAWQLTSQTWLTIGARQFIDCSGDSILAPLTGAAVRWGREARGEFDEDIEPNEADDKTMGNSILLQLRQTDQRQPFTPPAWAYRFDSPEDLPFRARGSKGDNYWWIEVGGLQDTIKDAEAISRELHALAWGVWDYLKNRSPEKDQAENWALEWLGHLPGKRENRRYVGDHTLCQNEVRQGEGAFDDTVAYGGWSMDDHHPAGIFYPGKPTIHHPSPSPFDIPYRSLYARDLDNLLFAGRNISVTHAALSATRVMATCAVIGQAAGTAAALCVHHRCEPRSLAGGERLRQLQQTLMDDDCWLPGRAREIDALARSASVDGQDAVLLDGHERDREDAKHAWEAAPGTAISFTWDAPVHVPGLRLSFDSNLSHGKRMPSTYPQNGDRQLVPDELVRAFRVEAREADGTWQTVFHEANNYQRLVRLPLNVRTDALRVIPEQTWGLAAARLFACEPMAAFADKTPPKPTRPTMREARARMDPADLAPPDSGLEAATNDAGRKASA